MLVDIPGAGIGAVLAQKLAADGAKLILSARRLNELTRVAASCKGERRDETVWGSVTQIEFSGDEDLPSSVPLISKLQSLIMKKNSSVM
jgi:NAD(P)-dependent dehydrogenase (short-subunit alcohol dehydrogenase family)